MLIKSPVKGSPFPISDLKIKQSSFRGNLVFGTVNKDPILDVGSGAGFGVKEALYTSLGEYLERLTQRKPSHKLNKNTLKCFNLNTEVIEELHLEKILIFDPQVFETESTADWNDSTGTAFHTDTISLIESSFFEFIERQSLVFNWLTQSPGKIVKLENYSSDSKIKKMTASLKSYFDHIYVFEISIHKRCPVVISIGVGKNFKSVGMGVGWSLKEAVYGSLKENLQGISHMIPNHMPDIHPFVLKDYENQEIPKAEEMYYADYFESLSPEDLLTEYQYLISKSQIYANCSEIYGKPSDEEYLGVLKEISEDLSVQLLICFIPSIIEDLPGSVIKINGRGAFPHIKTDDLDPSLYSIKAINTFERSEIPNLGRMVPFN